MGESGPKEYDPKFYEQFYYLTPQEREFFLAQIGIKDEEELKHHVMRVQEEALKVILKFLCISIPLILTCSCNLQVARYTCIRIFAFTKYVATWCQMS